MRSTCLHKMKHTGNICNYVDIKQLIYGYQKLMAIPGLRSKLRHFSLHTLIRWSFKILKVYMVLKNHELVYVKHEKCLFVHREEYSSMHTKKLGFNNAERSQVIQLIIQYKSFQIICRLNRWEENIKLRWQWNSVHLFLLTNWFYNEMSKPTSMQKTTNMYMQFFIL